MFTFAGWSRVFQIVNQFCNFQVKPDNEVFSLPQDLHDGNDLLLGN